MKKTTAIDIAIKVTSMFETGDRDPFTVVTGNFDGQGISMGPYQFNLGQGSLQPILKEIFATHPQVVYSTMGPLSDSFKELLDTKTPDEAVNLVLSWHATKGTLKPEWSKAISALGGNIASRQIFMKYMAEIQNRSWELSQWITDNKSTVRSYCLAHDLTVQNGGIGNGLRLALAAAHIPLKIYRTTLDRQGKSYQWAWLSVVAGARCVQTRITGQKRFFLDVIARKFLIVDGEDMFRGALTNLDTKFGVSDELVEE